MLVKRSSLLFFLFTTEKHITCLLSGSVTIIIIMCAVTRYPEGHMTPSIMLLSRVELNNERRLKGEFSIKNL